MNEELLKKVRRIHSLVKKAGMDPLMFEEIAALCGEMLSSEVLILSKKAKALEVYRFDGEQDVLESYWEKGTSVSERRAGSLNRITEVIENADLRVFGVGTTDEIVKSVLVPLDSAGQRMGTLIICRQKTDYTTDELIMLEFMSMVIARELAQAVYRENEQEKKKSEVIQAAIATLSYSELAAILHIFQELQGDEGLLVASKIADRVGITRSVIVNALRKFESAGVIESRSLGMKGTYIRILNSALRDELQKYGTGI